MHDQIIQRSWGSRKEIGYMGSCLESNDGGFISILSCLNFYGERPKNIDHCNVSDSRGAVIDTAI